MPWLSPGFSTDSPTNTFAASFLPILRTIPTTSKNGEEGPCVQCNLCDEVCPSGIYPSILYKHLGKRLVDEAAALGLELCVRCNLCSYVCPVKLPLAAELARGMDRVEAERAEDVSPGA
jgi:Na+-translocating ferredoxin:NAD+ oxidoreductase RnfC subunit